MREILFRGQTRKKGEKVRMDGTPVESNWVYGGIFQGQNHSVIYSYDHVEKHAVYSDTIGQYTGLKDKNGKRIFEGDIVRYSVIVRDCLLYQGTLKVVFERGSFCIEETDSGDTHTLYNNAAGVELEVIGNIHDNPELLEEA